MIWLLSMALGLQTAHAQDPAQVLADLSTAKSTCAAQMPALDKRVKASPGDQRARLARAGCLYRVGRFDSALNDLDITLKGRDVADANAEDRAGFVLYAILLAHTGRMADADQLLTDMSGAWGSDPGLFRAQTLRIAHGGAYPAAWARVDQALEKWPNHEQSTQLAGEMGSLDPDGMTDAAKEIITLPATKVNRYNVASKHLNSGSPSACFYEMERAMTDVDDEDRFRFQTLAYSCAVQAGRLASASRTLKGIGTTAAKRLPADAVIGHAQLFFDAGEATTAVRLLLLARPISSSQRAQMDTIKVRALHESGDVDTAFQIAQKGLASAASRANLAVTLSKGERSDDAALLLEGACPEMKGQAAADCLALLTRLRK